MSDDADFQEGEPSTSEGEAAASEGEAAAESESSSENDPSEAAENARDSFDDEEPEAVEPCHPAPPGGGSGSTGCSADQMKKNLAACDGGTDAWKKAKKAAGKEPDLKVGTPSSGFKAESDSSGSITVSSQDCCLATQLLVHELTNVSHGPDFNKLDSDAAKGDVAREDYTKANEKLEYDGVMTTLKAFDACKSKWGCGPSAKAEWDGYRKAKDFNDYYDHYLVESHKEYYRKEVWDKSYKAAWDKKHPPAAKP